MFTIIERINGIKFITKTFTREDEMHEWLMLYPEVKLIPQKDENWDYMYTVERFGIGCGYFGRMDGMFKSYISFAVAG